MELCVPQTFRVSISADSVQLVCEQNGRAQHLGVCGAQPVPQDREAERRGDQLQGDSVRGVCDRTGGRAVRRRHPLSSEQAGP
ncbi:hypothetical protein BpHYR1_049948, partial [Brachionus plicatilis]